jgi:NAD(P)-dependent dehydrogenase (short-subunit alcohol dehydrogenase family)
MNVRGTVVIITGASAGIGLATAHLFAEHGAKLALAARSAERLRQLVTDFGKNALAGSQRREGPPPSNMLPDSAEFVAQKILAAAQNEPAEQFMV